MRKELTEDEREFLITLGHAVRDERLKTKKNVVEMAQDAGLCHQTLYDIEAGKQAKIIPLFRLAEAMGINITRFFVPFF